MSKEETGLPDFNAMWDYSDPAGTEQKFRAILEDPEHSSSIDYQLELNTQIARTLGLQQKFDEGHGLLDNVISLLTNKTTVPSIRYHLERGRLFNSDNKREKALEQFQLAFDLAENKGEDYYAIDAAHMIAYALIEQPAEKLKWEEKALSIAEHSKIPKAAAWTGSINNNIGWSYFDMEDYDKAITSFEKSLVWEESKNNDGKARIAKWSIAKCKRMKGNVEGGLSDFMALEKEIEAAGADPDGYVYEEIGECLLTLKQKDKSVDYFARAYDLLSKDIWMQKNEAKRLERLKQLSE